MILVSNTSLTMHSHEISGDKENTNENGEHLKKRVRGAQMGTVRPTQVLSPTSSNSRLAHRETSPRKAPLSRPGSPLKGNGQSRSATAINALTNMVEKAKAARAAGSRKATTTTSTSRPATAISNKTRPVTTSRNQPSRPPTRVGRRLSNASDTSQSSTTTVVRKPTGTKATASSARKAITSSVRKATTSTKTSGTLQTSSSGRILRKRA